MRVIDGRNDGGAQVLEALEAVEGRVGQKTDRLKGRILALQVPRGPGKRSGGSKARDKMGDLPCRLLPDLRAGRVKMCQPVGIIRVLVHVAEPCRIVARQLAGPAYRAVRALVRVSPVHHRSISPKNPLAFRRY